jgi:hypothetical protein
LLYYLSRLSPLQIRPEGVLLSGFFDPGLFASEVAQIVQAGTSDLTSGDHFDPIDGRGMERKGSFHTDPVGDLSDGEIGPYITASPANNDPFEGLNPLLLSFHNTDKDFDGIARSEIGDISPHLFSFNHFHDIHST